MDEQHQWPAMRSPYDPPKIRSIIASTVLVKIVLRDNPPELNAPEHWAFAHYIPMPTSTKKDFAYSDGWFIRGHSDKDYKVIGWWPLPEPAVESAWKIKQEQNANDDPEAEGARILGRRAY